MEVKKNPNVDLERWRTIFTQVGLAVVLGILIVAFNWTTKDKTSGDLGQVIMVDMEEEIMATEREEQPEPPPPPPPAQEVIEELVIVENNEEVTDIDINTEATEQTMITQTDIKIQEEEVIEEPEVFLVVEEAPEFPGGTAALSKFINNTIRYPQVAKESGVSGRVYVNFVVDDKGNVTKIKIARGVDPALDAEAIRVVQAMPKWKPGKQRGKAVYVSYNLPLNFILQ